MPTCLLSVRRPDATVNPGASTVVNTFTDTVQSNGTTNLVSLPGPSNPGSSVSTSTGAGDSTRPPRRLRLIVGARSWAAEQEHLRAQAGLHAPVRPWTRARTRSYRVRDGIRGVGRVNGNRGVRQTGLRRSARLNGPVSSTVSAVLARPDRNDVRETPSPERRIIWTVNFKQNTFQFRVEGGRDAVIETRGEGDDVRVKKEEKGDGL